MSAAVVIMPAILLTRMRATGYIVAPHLRPTIAINVAIDILQATPRIISRCRGRFLPRHLSLAFRAILESMAWLFAVGTGHCVDVTTIADSRPFAFRNGPFRIALFAHCYHSSVECEVIICFGAIFYLQVFIRESFQHYAQ